jgi:hypothetical protein
VDQRQHPGQRLRPVPLSRSGLALK